MKLNMTCSITLPKECSINIDCTEVDMTPKQLLKFHDDLTQFINENWEALNKEDNV